jgi:hypothetical protein
MYGSRLAVVAGALTVGGGSVLFRSREPEVHMKIPWANREATPPTRQQQIATLKRGDFDLLIIGGAHPSFLPI